MGEGRKFDDGKLRYDLVPPYAFEQLVRVFTMGAAKYEDNNYRRGLVWSRVYAAIQRHLELWRKGEDVDQESGVSHLAHAAWGCFTLLEYSQMRKELDNRPTWWDEEWKSVSDYPMYEVSSLGRLRRNNKILTPGKQQNGYLIYRLYNNGKDKCIYAHRLVAQEFIGPIPEGFDVAHKNSVRDDNRADNLEFLTRSENLLEAIKQGFKPENNLPKHESNDTFGV
jgi:hypothetical protein